MTQKDMHSRERWLSPRRLRFVEEYLIDLNGTQAAIRAGYSPGTAKVTASRLLSDDNVAAAIVDGRRRLSKKSEITAERVIEELAKIGFATAADYFRAGADGRPELDTRALLDPARAAAIQQIDVTTNAKGETITRIKLADKKAALTDLGRHLALFEPKPPEPPANVENLSYEETRTLAMEIAFLLNSAIVKGGPLIDEEAGVYVDRDANGYLTFTPPER